MTPIVAGLLTPDQQNPRIRRILAGLGLVAALLALSVVADPLALTAFAGAAVCLTAVALYGADRRALFRFAAINGVAVLLLGLASAERTDLVIQRTPDQLDVSLNGVKLGASLAGLDPALYRVSVGLSAVDDRPMAAPWMWDSLPWLQGFGDWLSGGMRGGVERLSVTDANNSNLIPPLVGLWQPGHPTDPPLLAGGLDAWTVSRAPDQTVVLQSPELFTNRYQLVTTLARPSAQVTVTLFGAEDGPAIDVVVAPDRRQFAIVARPPDGPAETLVGGPFVYRGSTLGWILAILRDLGRVWVVALALVAASRLLAIPFSVGMPPLPRGLGWTMAGITGVALGASTLMLAALVATYLLDKMPHTVEAIAYLFQAQVIASGGMWAPAPNLPEFFQQAYIAATPDGRWFGVLPSGESLLLAAGLRAGAPWMVSPIAAGLAVTMTVVLGRATYGLLVGVVAGLLLLFSPFVLMLSGEMLAHPAALLLVVLMALGVVTALRGPVVWGWFLAGLAMGGLVLTRPLAAVGIGIPLTLVLVLSTRSINSRMLIICALLFAAAAGPGVFYAGFVNANLTGSPFLPPLSLWSDLDRIGFGPNIGTRGGHDLTSALGNTWTNLAVLLRHLYGWPAYLTLALAAVPFVLGSTNRWDRLLIIVFGGLTAAHVLYWSDGIIYGPRFEFEAVAALALLTARGATLLARGDGTVPDEGAEVIAGEVAQPALATAGLNGTHKGAVVNAAPHSQNGIHMPNRPMVAAVNGAEADGSPAQVGHDDDDDDLPQNHPSDLPPLPADKPAPAVILTRNGLSSVPLVAALMLALFAINLVGYLPELVLAYRDYNGISPLGLKVVREAGFEQPTVVFVSSDWPDWQSYGEVFLANGPFLDGPIVYARDLGEANNWSLMSKYPEWRWWQLRDHQLTEIRGR